MVRLLSRMTLVAVAIALAACSGGGMSSPSASGPAVGSGNTTIAMPNAVAKASTLETAAALPASLTVDNDDDGDDNVSILKRLTTNVPVGSTVPKSGELNPYGLDIAKADLGKIETGDLVVCNFNNSLNLGNLQGTGSSIVVVHPRLNSTAAPLELVKPDTDGPLVGCTELALAPNDTIWASAFAAGVNAKGDNPILSSEGKLLSALAGGPWNGPFGEAFANKPGEPAFYESNAGDGSIVRINVQPGRPFTFDVIATGFAVNHGKPGSILGPSGLQYDVKHDRLFIVDGANNTVVVLRHVSKIPAGGVKVNTDGKTFSGLYGKLARLVFSDHKPNSPLYGPISSALLPNGHLVIGNTLDPTGNFMIEITPRGNVLAVKNVDPGVGGAIFGMVASGTGESDTKIYYNDDNSNTVNVLTQ